MRSVSADTSGSSAASPAAATPSSSRCRLSRHCRAPTSARAVAGTRRPTRTRRLPPRADGARAGDSARSIRPDSRAPLFSATSLSALARRLRARSPPPRRARDTPDRGARTLDRSRATRARGSVPLARRRSRRRSATRRPDAALAGAAKKSRRRLLLRGRVWFKHALEWIALLDERLLALFADLRRSRTASLFAVIFCETGLVIATLPARRLVSALRPRGARRGRRALLQVRRRAFCSRRRRARRHGELFLGSWIGGRVIEVPLGVQTLVHRQDQGVLPDARRQNRRAGAFLRHRAHVRAVRRRRRQHATTRSLSRSTCWAAVWVMSFMGLGYFFGQIPGCRSTCATDRGGHGSERVPMVIEVVKHVFAREGTASAASIKDVDATIDDIAARVASSNSGRA